MVNPLLKNIFEYTLKFEFEANRMFNFDRLLGISDLVIDDSKDNSRIAFVSVIDDGKDNSRILFGSVLCIIFCLQC